jgi:hypothetical protein
MHAGATEYRILQHHPNNLQKTLSILSHSSQRKDHSPKDAFGLLRNQDDSQQAAWLYYNTTHPKRSNNYSAKDGRHRHERHPHRWPFASPQVDVQAFCHRWQAFFRRLCDDEVSYTSQSHRAVGRVEGGGGGGG